MGKLFINGKTIEFAHTAMNKDLHMFIDGYHNPTICPECIQPGVFAASPPKENLKTKEKV